MNRDSIHWRRRWFYMLWGLLFAGALVALVCWNTPVRPAAGKLSVAVRFTDPGDPAGLAVSMGSFPRGGRPGEWKAMALKDGRFVGELQIPLAFRRWTGVPFHGRCHEGVMLRAERGGEHRYFLINLQDEVASGLFCPRQRMILECNEVEWGRLPKDIPPLPRLP